MFKIKFYLAGIFLMSLTLTFSACQTTTGNNGRIQTYSFNVKEADWIRNGEAIQFEGEQWYPFDDIEVMTDSEVYVLGEYKDIQFFAAKTDVRPYARIYTKFGVNQFRYYLKRKPE